MKLIPLTRGLFAMVDDKDYEDLSKHKWFARHSKGGVFYPSRMIGDDVEHMHRRIMNCPEGFEVDHRDLNPLNNQRSNLRICTRSQNRANVRAYRGSKLGVKGVYLHKGFYEAKIQINKIPIHLGCYRDLESAVKARRAGEVKYHGEFAFRGDV